MCSAQCAYPAVSCVWCNRSVHVKYFGGTFFVLSLYLSVCIRLLPICMRMMASLIAFFVVLPLLMSSFRSFEIVLFVFAGDFPCSISEFDIPNELCSKTRPGLGAVTNNINCEIGAYYNFIVFSHQQTSIECSVCGLYCLIYFLQDKSGGRR